MVDGVVIPFPIQTNPRFGLICPINADFLWVVGVVSVTSNASMTKSAPSTLNAFSHRLSCLDVCVRVYFEKEDYYDQSTKHVKSYITGAIVQNCSHCYFMLWN
jgi:hypothetical protein